MFRCRAAPLFVAAAAGAENGGAVKQHQPLELQSAYQLLRLLLRSAECKVRSRQGRQFLKRRIITQWRAGRDERDPVKQRALMERAAAVLHAMHIKGRSPTADQPIEVNFEESLHIGNRASLN